MPLERSSQSDISIGVSNISIDVSDISDDVSDISISVYDIRPQEKEASEGSSTLKVLPGGEGACGAATARHFRLEIKIFSRTSYLLFERMAKMRSDF